MKSRAPSGVDLIRFGVSISTKPFAWWTSRIAWTSRLRRSMPLLHRLAAQVEIAVAQAEALVDRGIGLVDVERRRLRLRQDLDLGRPELDLAGLAARGSPCRSCAARRRPRP